MLPRLSHKTDTVSQKFEVGGKKVTKQQPRRSLKGQLEQLQRNRDDLLYRDKESATSAGIAKVFSVCT